MQDDRGDPSMKSQVSARLRSIGLGEQGGVVRFKALGLPLLPAATTRRSRASQDLTAAFASGRSRSWMTRGFRRERNFGLFVNVNRRVFGES
jgi:hypothetical protein